MTLNIFHPQDAPVYGLCSVKAPASLGRGQYSVLKNFRLDRGYLRVRDAVASQDVALFTGTLHGGWAGTLNGTYYYVAVTQAASNPLDIKASTGSSLANMSASSGKYGDTRLSASYKQISFCPVKDNKSGKEYLLIGDGVSYPRIWNPAEADTGEKVAIHQPMSAMPTKVPGTMVVPTFPKYATIKDGTATSWTTSGATFGSVSESSGASTTANYMNLVYTAASWTAGHYAQMNFAAVDFSDCPQLILFCETTSFREWINRTKIEIVDSTGNSTIWDPASTTATSKTKYEEIQLDTTGTRFMYVFNLQDIGSTLRDAVTAVKFTVASGTSAPSANATVKVYGVYGSGKIKGQCLHTLCYFNQGSRAESQGIVFDANQYKGEYVRKLGTYDGTEVTLPIDPRVYYAYDIYYLNPGQTDLDAGWDAINVYRADPGEDYSLRSYVTTDQIAAYSGSWSLDSGTVNSIVSYRDNNSIDTKDPTILAPDELTLTIPKGLWYAQSTNRLFVASYDTTGSQSLPSFGTLWCSEFRNQFRFRRYHDIEEDGTSFQFSGEYPTAIATLPTNAYGVDDLLVWTGKNLWRFSATSASAFSRPSLLAPFGTWTPYSIAKSNYAVYWLDHTRHVKVLQSGSVEDISENTIQDKLDLICGTSWDTNQYVNYRFAHGIFFNQRYYLSFDQSGATTASTVKENPCVFETRINPATGSPYGWTEDVIADTSYSACFWAPNNSKLRCFSTSGHVLEYETTSATLDGYVIQSQSGGTAYSAILQTGMMLTDLKDNNEGLVVQSHEFLIDDASGGSIALVNDYSPTGQSTMTCSSDGTVNVGWVISDAVTIASGEGRGIGVQCKATLTGTNGVAGKAIHSWRCTVNPVPYRPTNLN